MEAQFQLFLDKHTPAPTSDKKGGATTNVGGGVGASSSGTSGGDAGRDVDVADDIE